MRGALAIALVPLLAGCAIPEEAEDDGVGEGPCESRFGGTLAPIVSLVPALQDDPDVALLRLAEIVGDAPEGAPVTEGAAVVWPASNGTFRWVRDGNASARVSYTPDTPYTDAGARANLEAAFASFSQPFEIAYAADGLAGLQSIRGVVIEGTGGSYANGTLSVGPLLQLDPNVELLDDATLGARALEIARCVDADASADGAVVLSWMLRDEWLVRRVEVPSGPADCAGGLQIDVHAVEGAIVPPVLCGAQPTSEQGNGPR